MIRKQAITFLIHTYYIELQDVSKGGMKIIVAGAGEVGTHLAKMLSNEKHDIIVIDPDAEKLHLLNPVMI
jgi:threonine dehydrogenase-like Zn-dependent dehydrogenase